MTENAKHLVPLRVNAPAVPQLLVPSRLLLVHHDACPLEKATTATKVERFKLSADGKTLRYTVAKRSALLPKTLSYHYNICRR